MPLVRAKFAWKAQDVGELSFEAGDVINVVDQSQEGWWQGTLNGEAGFFPNNYVEVIEQSAPPSRNSRRAGGGASSRPSSRGPSPGPHSRASSRGPSPASSPGTTNRYSNSRASTNASLNSAGSTSSLGSTRGPASHNLQHSGSWSEASYTSQTPLIDNYYGAASSRVSSRPSSRGPPSGSRPVSRGPTPGSRGPSSSRLLPPGSRGPPPSSGGPRGPPPRSRNSPVPASRGSPSVGSRNPPSAAARARGSPYSAASSPSVQQKQKQPQAQLRADAIPPTRPRAMTRDTSDITDDDWDQRARAKGAPPFLQPSERSELMDRLIADARSSYNGGKNSRGARALAANALRAVTLYDNNRHQGITDFDDSCKQFSMGKLCADDQPMTWSQGSSTDNFARTKYGVWASNMAIGTALSLATFGPMSIIWALWDQQFADMLGVELGIYACGIAVLIAVAEKWKGYPRSGTSVISYRGIAYLLMSVPLFFTYPLIITGAMLIITAFANFYSSAIKEQNIVQEKKKMAKTKWGMTIGSLAEENRLSKVAFLSMFAAANILIFVFAFEDTALLNASLPLEDQVSGYGPWAKGFGNVLDFTCAIILVPVARTFIRWLYNISTADQGGLSRFVRGVLWFFPIDKAILFHKFVSFIILVATIGHTISHFLNYVIAPNQTLALYGLVPWYTGGAIILIMLIMYPAAMKNVKATHFELFWYSHHLFIFFYALLIVHGNMGFGPNFWKWYIVPGTLYTAERILREYNANKDVVLVSVTFMKPDCYSLRFAKKGVFASGYKEGQYVFLNCPYVARHEWHPFTLSSAPDEDAASLHIRIQNRMAMSAGENDKSWTQRTKEYLQLLVPAGAVYHEFVSNAGQDVGIVKGPDGQSVLKIDGPHSAPTQHVSEYSTTMICGAGIGVTPLAATLKSITHHRWRTAVGNAYPNNAEFYWVCSHRDLQAFRWMIRTIKDATDAAWNRRVKDKSKHDYHVHCFITSVPKDAEKPRLSSIPGDSVGFWGSRHRDNKNVSLEPAPFSEQELYQLCMAPPKEPTKVCELVTVYNGRPNWKQCFEAVKAKHASNEEIGVMFCGSPVIARDLKAACAEHSDASAGRFFRLHKENF